MNRTARTFAASLLAVSLCSFIAPAAFAQEVQPSSVNLIDPTSATELVVHKRLGTVPGAAGNGQPTEAPGAPLEGIMFDLYQVEGVDLTTNAGWLAASALQSVKLTIADVTAGSVTGTDGVTYTLTKATSGLTDTNGETALSGKVGLYVVAENLADSTFPDITKVSPSAPFLVTLPMTNPNGPDGVAGTSDDNTTWDYSIDVYPKNTSDTIHKTVLDGNPGVTDQHAYTQGQNLTYHLESSFAGATLVVPDRPAVPGPGLGFYVISDPLDSGLEFLSATVKLDDRTVLTEGVDYTVTISSENVVSISMLQLGLDKMAAYPSPLGTGTVSTDIVAKVVSVGDDNVVPNQAFLVPSKAWWEARYPSVPVEPGDAPQPGTDVPGISSEKVETRFSTLYLRKIAGQREIIYSILPPKPPLNVDPTTPVANGQPLAGAEFAVYLDQGDNGCTTEGDIAGFEPIARSQAPTDDNGETTVRYLQQPNFYNGDFHNDAMHRYCLVETKAPAGFELLADPVDVKRGWDNPYVPLEVSDSLSNLGGKLPLTGGQGIVALAAAGLGLGTVGVGGYFTANKRRKAADNA